jgi:hypothetical protein
MDEEAMLTTLIDEAVHAGHEHGAALALTYRVLNRGSNRESDLTGALHDRARARWPPASTTARTGGRGARAA